MAQANTSHRLREAILYNDLPLVKRLLKSSPSLLPNPNLEDKSNTSLHLASIYGHVQIAVC